MESAREMAAPEGLALGMEGGAVGPGKICRNWKSRETDSPLELPERTVPPIPWSQPGEPAELLTYRVVR